MGLTDTDRNITTTARLYMANTPRTEYMDDEVASRPISAEVIRIMDKLAPAAYWRLKRIGLNVDFEVSLTRMYGDMLRHARIVTPEEVEAFRDTRSGRRGGVLIGTLGDGRLVVKYPHGDGRDAYWTVIIEGGGGYAHDTGYMY
ncbi:hypothetical protein EMO89_00125 [Bifidobacterium tissieri]|uniref:Uncharacterized protein n=1 Tax=Bifidobacterium tissieri TaxID=1630162 RepID=A0A5M9ZWL5_9BIFI|nr:hypothetical protein [Bifidobacterium tissieri]KAA8831970.1 hypothetical protein EMO89_00125 [Bifidobacterium tissieri]